jgi:IS5 family transposase
MEDACPRCSLGFPDDITVHLDAGYDSAKTRDELTAREMTGT